MHTRLEKYNRVALERLAELLDVDFDHLESLLIRVGHPLPAPPQSQSYDRCPFTKEYLDNLIKWVVRESRCPTSTHDIRMNASLVQQKVHTMLGDLKAYDFDQSFPPGHFLG